MLTDDLMIILVITAMIVLVILIGIGMWMLDEANRLEDEATERWLEEGERHDNHS